MGGNGRGRKRKTPSKSSRKVVVNRKKEQQEQVTKKPETEHDKSLDLDDEPTTLEYENIRRNKEAFGPLFHIYRRHWYFHEEPVGILGVNNDFEKPLYAVRILGPGETLDDIERIKKDITEGQSIHNMRFTTSEALAVRYPDMVLDYLKEHSEFLQECKPVQTKSVDVARAMLLNTFTKNELGVNGGLIYRDIMRNIKSQLKVTDKEERKTGEGRVTTTEREQSDSSKSLPETTTDDEEWMKESPKNTDDKQPCCSKSLTETAVGETVDRSNRVKHQLTRLYDGNYPLTSVMSRKKKVEKSSNDPHLDRFGLPEDYDEDTDLSEYDSSTSSGDDILFDNDDSDDDRAIKLKVPPRKMNNCTPLSTLPLI